ncbi:ribokinase [Parapedobacter deserti]|uniref:Ribokinase n=1 Tax=Parapedobacter deserti TaxID=1912957 RepID=A0ABV7JQC0_9SPHI
MFTNYMTNKIIVVGSMNMDMVVKTSHIPQPGETVLGGSFLMNPGGKGANQESSQLFDEEGVDTNGILADDNSPSGIALITVDERGENSIVVAPGANAHLEPGDVEKVLDNYPGSKILLIQLEIPMRTVEHAAGRARDRGMKVILNPAPANAMVHNMFHLIDIITPNVNEAEMLFGVRITDISSARQAAERIHEQGVKQVIVTLGKDGAALLEDGAFYHIPAPKVETVDTTAAGDVFNGALAVAVGEGKLLKDAVSFACRAASLAVTRMGAQSSIPFRNEVLLSSMT